MVPALSKGAGLFFDEGGLYSGAVDGTSGGDPVTPQLHFGKTVMFGWPSGGVLCRVMELKGSCLLVVAMDSD